MGYYFYKKGLKGLKHLKNNRTSRRGILSFCEGNESHTPAEILAYRQMEVIKMHQDGLFA